jgi:hypothetical protein
MNTVQAKLWKTLILLSFSVYALICLAEGYKLYFSYSHEQLFPLWAILLLLSIVVLIPGSLVIFEKKLRSWQKFFFGLGRILLSFLLLVSCLISQREIDNRPPSFVVHSTSEDRPVTAEDLRLVFRQAHEPVQFVTESKPPMTLSQCFVNGRRSLAGTIAFDELNIRKACLENMYRFGSDRE